MPPRAAPRARAPPPPKKQKVNATPAQPEPTVPIVYSAAREVYGIAELRQRIISLLEKPGLKKCMRVGESIMCDAVGMIYRSIDYGKVEAIKTVPAARQRIYASAVSEIHATEEDIPREFFVLGGGTFYRSRRRRPLEKYHPKMCKSISDSLRSLFPNLRKVYYGRDQGNQSWVLDFPFSTPSLPSANTDASLIGHVQVLNSVNLHLPCSPLTAMQVQARPARGYSMSQRFNLVLYRDYNGPTSPAITAAWLASLRNNPLYGDLYTILNLADLPAAVDDMTSIIKRQLEMGHTDRLQGITAICVLPFDTKQFSRFANVAASSLTVLYLADKYVAERQQHGIAFSDLGALVSIIQDHLPQLQKLRMAVSGIETAESVCRDLLPVDVGQRPGKLSELELFTPHHTIPLFNVIRCLAPLCARDISFCVGDYNVGDDQEYFLDYIVRQPHDRRIHLNLVDFFSIGVGQLSEVHRLEYSASGHPQSLTIKKATIALSHLRAASAESKNAILLNVEEVVNACQAMATHLENITSMASTPGFIDEAKALVETIRQAQNEVYHIRNRLLEVSDSISPIAQSVQALIKCHEAMEAGGY